MIHIMLIQHGGQTKIKADSLMAAIVGKPKQKMLKYSFLSVSVPKWAEKQAMWLALYNGED